MKRIFLMTALFFTTLIVLQSCSPKTTNGAVALKKGNVTGNWVLNNITFDGIPEIAVKSFLGENSYKCFVGSTWNFVSNNNKGDVTLSKSGCANFTSPITWYVNTEGNFVMKVLNADEKAKKVLTGYILKVANQTENSFQLVDRINVGGTLTDVVYQFIKQ